jgi:hypothetical protein
MQSPNAFSGSLHLVESRQIIPAQAAFQRIMLRINFSNAVETKGWPKDMDGLG